MRCEKYRGAPVFSRKEFPVATSSRACTQRDPRRGRKRKPWQSERCTIFPCLRSACKERLKEGNLSRPSLPIARRNEGGGPSFFALLSPRRVKNKDTAASTSITITAGRASQIKP